MPNTYIATVFAISYTGARPVLVDVDPESCTIDVEKIEEAITPRTKAIIPVHLYGQPAEMDKIKSLAETYDLFVVEDAAQAHGTEFKSQKAPYMKKELKLRDNDYLILIAARLTKIKGIHRAIKVMPKLEGEFKKSIHLVILGDGDQKSELMRLASELGESPPHFFFSSTTILQVRREFNFSRGKFLVRKF